MDDKSFQELKNRSLYARLKRLFSNELIVRNIGGKKLKVVDINSLEYATDRNSLRDRFNRLRTSATNNYSRDFNLAFQRNRIELFRDYDCLSGDTIIPLPNIGNITIKELCNLYKNKEERFNVYSFDLESDYTVIGKAFNPRSKGIRDTWIITFTDGDSIRATEEHLFLLKSSNYVKLKDLRVGEYIMSNSSIAKKIKLIEYYGKEEVYDLSVDKYHNFSTANCFVHNCMDMDPILHSALDIYADECLFSDTIIPLIDGSKHTIKSLYENKFKNFFVYSEDENGYSIKSLCERVAYNGKKEMVEITFDDGTIVKCTFNHIWQLSSGKLIYTENLKIGNFIKSYNSNNLFLSNDELINSDNRYIINIKKLDGLYDAYDLVNVGDTHLYAIESNNGSKIITHNCVTKNEMGEIIKIYSTNDDIKNLLENLFYDILNVEHNLWSWVRSLAKYGDFYLRLYISPEYGVYFVKPYSAYHVTRIENSDLTNKSNVKFQVTIPEGNRMEELDNYQMVHFRLLSDSNFLPQGLSMLEGARRVWKQLCVSGLTKIWTSTGYKYIKDINVGDDVYCFNKDTLELKKTKVSIIRKTGKNVKTLTIKSAYKEFSVTPDHKLLIKDYDSNKLIYKEAKDIFIDTYFSGKFSDKLVLPTINTGNDFFVANIADELFDEKLLKSNIIYNSKESTVTITPDLIQLCGFLFAHNILKNKLQANKEDYFNKYLKYHLDFNTLEKILKHILYNNNNVEKIPDWIFNLSKLSRIQFINGFIDAYSIKPLVNSHLFLNHNPDIHIVLNNKILLEQYKALCEMSGIFCSEVQCDTINEYSININLNKTYDLYYEKILSIKENPSVEDVWNITVEDDIHNYVMEGIVSKNCLMEDALLIFRIMRAPEKRIFKIDVGNLPPAEIDNEIERIKNQLSKVPYVDQETGEYNLRFNMQNMLEDFFLPVRGGDSGTQIDTLKGLDWAGIDDIEYLRNKLMAALKIPKAFLGYDQDLSGKATLASEDVRFGRTIQRLQNFVLSGLVEIAVIHLYSCGYRDENLLDFQLELTNPSTIFEKEQLEIWKSKIEVCQGMQEQKLFPRKWMYEHLFGMSDQDIIEIQKQMVDDAKSNYRFSQIENDGVDPVIKFLKSKKGEENMEGSNLNFGNDIGGNFGGEEDFGGYTEKEPSQEAPNPAQGEGDLTEKWTPPSNNKIIKKRDQRGRKDASKYPFGEDPLGNLENNRKQKDPFNESIANKNNNTTHISNKKISMRKVSELMRGYNENTVELLKEEVANQGSYMDEKL